MELNQETKEEPNKYQEISQKKRRNKGNVTQQKIVKVNKEKVTQNGQK